VLSETPLNGAVASRTGIRDHLLLGKLGQGRVMAGMRRSQTIVEEDGFWLRGHDGAHEFVSVALGRDWVNRELGSCKV
jgi:hypothetical protein